MNKKQKSNNKKDLINKKDKQCFQYAGTVALNHEEIGTHSERITKIKAFTKNITGKT